VPKRCTLINVINKYCTLFVFFLYGLLVLLRQWIARGSPLGTTTEVQRVGIPFGKNRFVSAPGRDLVACLVFQVQQILRDPDKVFQSLPRSPGLWIRSSGPLAGRRGFWQVGST
jgi:hypothetical protein